MAKVAAASDYARQKSGSEPKMPVHSPKHSPAALHRALILAALLLGVPSGLGIYTFIYAGGTAYFSDDPKACVNCHVMREPFAGWSHSSHKAVASCNDCHTSKGFPNNWYSKGVNGWNHSVAFTTGNFPDPIRIRDFNARIVRQNCVGCHQILVSEIHSADPRQQLSCIACHGNVGHGD